MSELKTDLKSGARRQNHSGKVNGEEYSLLLLGLYYSPWLAAHISKVGCYLEGRLLALPLLETMGFDRTACSLSSQALSPVHRVLC